MDFCKDYPRETAFADWAFRVHFKFLEDTRVKHITATEKNICSTPAYPKLLDYVTEADYLEEHGWRPYVEEFARIDRGARPHVLWFLFLKKEVLRVEKIKSSDIRQILCADPIYARIGACFEQHQNDLMKERTNSSCGQCGWTPFQGGFKRMCQRLASKPGTFVEFDWTRFDGTIPTQLFLRIKRLRWQFINKDQRERYAGMYQWYCKNLVCRYVLLPSGEITKQNRGNPSGQISTTMDNNMVNYWLQAFEFAYFFGPDKELWRDYDTVVYGDDRLSRYPILPLNYRERVVEMYKNIFGMWVKLEKVKVSPTLYGLTFCGFEIALDYQPKPAQPAKLFAGLLKPARTVEDVNALHGKLLSLQILMHFEDDTHPFKRYIESCLATTSRFIDDALPKRFTREQLDRLWRGGPKQCNG